MMINLFLVVSLGRASTRPSGGIARREMGRAEDDGHRLAIRRERQVDLFVGDVLFPHGVVRPWPFSSQ
jgi:hypothetical protein